MASILGFILDSFELFHNYLTRVVPRMLEANHLGHRSTEFSAGGAERADVGKALIGWER